MGFSTTEIALMAAAGGAAASMALAPKAPSIPKPQDAIAPPESQAAKTPDADTISKGVTGMGQAGGSPGIAQTFLTGAGGIDQDSLKLSRSTLLGI